MQQYQQNRHVLGSEAQIILVVQDSTPVNSIFDALWSKIEAFEARFSRFKPDSELSHFNAKAGKWVTISDEFSALLDACRHYEALTDGLFNPLVLPLLQQIGYQGSWPAPNNADPKLDVRHRKLHHMTDIQVINGQACMPKDAALDLGGIGKGYALDMIHQLLTGLGIENYCVTLGGDIICKGYNAAGNPWRIGIAKAGNDSEGIGLITNGDGLLLAIASSSVVKRKGSGWHHIVDPRTGVSSDSSVLMATVLARSGTAADIFAKSITIDPNILFQTSRPTDNLVAKVLQHKDGSITSQQEGNFIALSGRSKASSLLG